MNFNAEELRFLTALIREQNQNGCRGPAHDLLRQHVYPDLPCTGPGSLTFAYEAVPLTSMLLQDFTDLQGIDDFVRNAEPTADVKWPWPSADAYRAALDQARREWSARRSVAPVTPAPVQTPRTQMTNK